MRRISKNSTSDSIWHKDGQDRLLSHQVSCRVVTKNNPKKHSQTDKKKFYKSIVHPNTSRKQVLHTEWAFQY